MTRLNEFENNIDRQLIDNYQPTPKNVRTILKAKNKRNKVKGENSEEATDDKTQEASEKITFPEDYEFKDVVKKFRELKKNIPKKCEDKSQLLQQLKIAIDKAQMTTTVNYQEVPNEGYSCSVLIDNVFVAKGTAPNKKQAKGNAYENALELLQKDALIVEKKVSEEEDEDSEQLVLVGGGVHLVMSDDDGSDDDGSVVNDELLKQAFGEFVIFKNNENENVKTILSVSCMMNKVDFKVIKTTKIHFVTMNSLKVAMGSPLKALEASENAIKRLERVCPTVVLKELYEADEQFVVMREDLMQEDGVKCLDPTIIPDSNIGVLC